MRQYTFEYLDCDDIEEIFSANNLEEAEKKLADFCRKYNDLPEDYLLVKITENDKLIWKFETIFNNFPKNP